METQMQINSLEARQLELRAIMASSDGRAAKCMKNGTVFRDIYPDDYETYNLANSEYNANELEIVRLKAVYETEIAQNAIE